MRPLFPSIFAAVLLAATPVRAQPAAPPDPFPHVAVRLSFKTIEGCPGESAFRAQVAAWVGYDPFSPGGVDLITLWFDRVGKKYRASYTLTDADGPSGIAREVDTDCAALFRTMGIAVGLAVAPSNGPVPLAPPAPAPEPEPPVAPAPAPLPALPPPAPVPAPVPAPPKRAVAIVAGVDLVYNPVIAPTGSAGAAPWIGVRLREPSLSFELGLRAMGSLRAVQELVPTTTIYVPLRWTYVAGVVAASVHRGPFFAGSVVEVGSLTTRSNDPRSELSASNPAVVAAGFRVGVERSFGGLFTIRSLIEGEYVPGGAYFQEPQLRRLIRTTPSFSSTVAIGLVFHLQ